MTLASYTYPDNISIKDKIISVATKIYGAEGVNFSPSALKSMDLAEREGYADYPVCIAKTQYSFSDDPKKTGSPKNFKITIRGIKVSAGAGFIVAYAGDIMTMPGLPKVPQAVNIDISDSGEITGII